MVLTVFNKTLTTVTGEVYEVGKYITVSLHMIKNRNGEWGSTDQYYIKGFSILGPGLDRASIGIQGRFKGDSTETGLCGPSVKNLADPVMIHRLDADMLRHKAGKGKKNRYVGGSDGYIWLPDFMIFDDPYKILHWAADPQYTHFKEPHDAPPDPTCFPDWIAEEHGFQVVEQE
jgi:hypothetical protein